MCVKVIGLSICSKQSLNWRITMEATHVNIKHTVKTSIYISKFDEEERGGDEGGGGGE